MSDAIARGMMPPESLAEVRSPPVQAYQPAQPHAAAHVQASYPAPHAQRLQPPVYQASYPAPSQPPVYQAHAPSQPYPQPFDRPPPATPPPPSRPPARERTPLDSYWIGFALLVLVIAGAASLTLLLIGS